MTKGIEKLLLKRNEKMIMDLIDLMDFISHKDEQEKVMVETRIKNIMAIIHSNIKLLEASND